MGIEGFESRIPCPQICMLPFAGDILLDGQLKA